MLYRELAEYYDRLEMTSKKLEKTEILSELYIKAPERVLYKVVLLSMGLVYPQGDSSTLGIASEMAKKIIEKSCGISEKELEKRFKETGDLGLTAEYFVKNRKQTTLEKKNLSVDFVFDSLRKLPDITGAGSQEKKMAFISNLLSQASGKEARYIIRTVLGEMRIGVAAGIVRDAIAKAFEKEKGEIERAYDLLGDYGRVAEMAKKGRLKADIVLGCPIRVMLAERAGDLKEALDAFGHPAIEMKLDGFRAQIHKDGDKIKIFSRRLDEVTKQFPEMVERSRKCIKAEQAIVEGEIVAVKPDGSPLPFQNLSRRIQRKYDIERMVREIPVRIDLFDLIYINGENWMHKRLEERWKKLKEIIEPMKNKFQLVEHIETKDFKEVQDFYNYCLKLGEEGVIIKNMEAHYQPGKRVGYWLKVKPIMEPLDLVIVGATWGEGKRSKWLGSLVLAARDEKTGEFVPTGMMGSGLTEEQLEEITGKLKKIIVSEAGREVKVKPQIVVEVAYEEIQKSPTYPSGYALRFPRLLRFREGEKRPEDSDTVQTIEKLYRQQRGRSRKRV